MMSRRAASAVGLAAERKKVAPVSAGRPIHSVLVRIAGTNSATVAAGVTTPTRMRPLNLPFRMSTSPARPPA